MNTSDQPTGPAGEDKAMRYEQISLRFLDAYDQDDLHTIAELWQQAETDAELERILCELNEGLLHESNLPRPAQPGPARIEELIHRSMPSAYLAGEFPAIAVSDVASSIKADRVMLIQLKPADREANERLLSVRMALPEKLDGRAIMKLIADLPVTASAVYWRAFQQAAILLKMTQGQLARAAARQAYPRRRSSRRKDEGK